MRKTKGAAGLCEVRRIAYIKVIIPILKEELLIRTTVCVLEKEQVFIVLVAEDVQGLLRVRNADPYVSVRIQDRDTETRTVQNLRTPGTDAGIFEVEDAVIATGAGNTTMGADMVFDRRSGRARCYLVFR